MLNHLFGWYVRENLGGKFITIVYEKSLAAAATGQFTIADAINGLKHASDLVSYDYILLDIFAYANPGFVKIEMIPEGDQAEAFRLECTPHATRTALSPPKLVETDMRINYVNEAVANDIYINISALRLPENSTPKFTVLSGMIPAVLSDLAVKSSDMVKLLVNIQNLLEKSETTYAIPGVARYEEEVERREFCKRGLGGCR